MTISLSKSRSRLLKSGPVMAGPPTTALSLLVKTTNDKRKCWKKEKERKNTPKTEENYNRWLKLAKNEIKRRENFFYKNYTDIWEGRNHVL